MTPEELAKRNAANPKATSKAAVVADILGGALDWSKLPDHDTVKVPAGKYPAHIEREFLFDEWPLLYGTVTVSEWYSSYSIIARGRNWNRRSEWAVIAKKISKNISAAAMAAHMKDARNYLIRIKEKPEIEEPWWSAYGLEYGDGHPDDYGNN